jgi:hypothetical protein
MADRELMAAELCEGMRQQLMALTSAVEAHLLGMQRLSVATWSADTTGDKALALLRDLELALNTTRVLGLGFTARSSLFGTERGEVDGSQDNRDGIGGGKRMRF